MKLLIKEKRFHIFNFHKACASLLHPYLCNILYLKYLALPGTNQKNFISKPLKFFSWFMFIGYGSGFTTRHFIHWWLWTNICYCHCEWNALDVSSFFLELVDIYWHAVLDTVSPPSSRCFTGLLIVDATISVINSYLSNGTQLRIW